MVEGQLVVRNVDILVYPGQGETESFELPSHVVLPALGDKDRDEYCSLVD